MNTRSLRAETRDIWFTIENIPMHNIMPGMKQTFSQVFKVELK